MRIKYVLAIIFVLLLFFLIKGGHFKKEIIIVEPVSEEKEAVSPLSQKTLFEYIKITDSCGPRFDGECLNVRSGPGEKYPVITQLRKNIVLKIGAKVERDGRVWHKIVFDEWLRYPERIKDDWYVAGDFVHLLLDEGILDWTAKIGRINPKRIIVDRSEQMLYAYDGSELFMQEHISTGLEMTPTPRGSFSIFKKTPSRYMQGPIPGISEKEYDLPGVPWNLYFTYQGAVIHGTYWHENFGKQASNGCVNLAPDKAQKLYNWTKIGTRVIVRD